MPTDHSLDFRRALVTALNGEASIAALVTKVYGTVVPSGAPYDFVRVGTIDPEQFEATCLNGMEAEFFIHTFAKGSDDVPCRTLAKAVSDFVDGLSLDFSGAHTVAMDWVRSQFVRDTAETGVWHGIITVVVQTSDDF